MCSQIHLQQSYLDLAICEAYATYMPPESNLTVHCVLSLTAYWEWMEAV